MSDSLLPDIYKYLFQCARFYLRDILKLMAVSKQLRQISLSEENWYTIIDMAHIMHAFIRHVTQHKIMADIPYPFHRIQRMHFINRHYILFFESAIFYEFCIMWPDHRDKRAKFYECFPDYQYMYVCEKNDIEHFGLKSLKSLYINFSSPQNEILEQNLFHDKIIIEHTITRIDALGMTVDCNFLIKNYWKIELLAIDKIYNIEHLYNVKLRFLRINSSIKIDEIIRYLPSTLEMLILPSGQYTTSLALEQLKMLPYLNALEINCPLSEVSLTLDIRYVHFIINFDGKTNIKINVPNVRNIIITFVNFTCPFQLQLTSLNAVSCQIIGADLSNLSLAIPNCINNIPNDKSIIMCDANVFNNYQRIMTSKCKYA
jgi:hypothetical protein